jgi:broad specificity phosphatase PhoE
VEIVFVRHGEPAWAFEGRPEMDPRLTQRGHEQARLVAERLAPRRIDAVLVSPARRARETAAPLLERLGRAPVVIDDFLEIRLPDYSQQSLHDVARVFAEARKRNPDEWWEGIPGGESFRDFRVRVERGVRAMLADRGVEPLPEHHDALYRETAEPKQRIVVVGHGGTNTVAMGVLLGFESAPWEWERFALHHTGISRLRTIPLGAGVVFSLQAHNDCEHLTKELRTR